MSQVEEVAKEIFGEKYRIEKNNSTDFALIVKQSRVRPAAIFPHLDFCVYDIELDSIIFRHSVNHGNVGWQNDHQIFFETIPTRAESKRTRQYFDVKSQKSTTLDP
ncbi:MAG: hypothetical protein HKN87_09525 [Saprospiraceae bacterium]|nr:hypothetical protein [Saprospiraceae bacterium]